MQSFETMRWYFLIVLLIISPSKLHTVEEFPGDNNRRARNLRDNMLCFRNIDQIASLNALREQDILNEDEARLISSKSHWKKRAYYLTETILQKGNRAIDVFLQTLTVQGRHELVALIETGEMFQ